MTVQLLFLEYLCFYERIHLPVNQVSTVGIFSIDYIVFWYYLEVLKLKTMVFNNLGLEKICAHTMKSKVCHTDYNLTLLSYHG
jgi:hypothetical protein